LVRVPMTADGERSIASLVEINEAEVWARCIELAATMPGDPLGAVIDRSGPVPLPALTAADSSSFNRVVALGVGAPATPDCIDRIVAHYRDLGQRNFRVELAPVAGPPELTGWLERAGLRPVSEGMTKVWRRLEDVDVDLDLGLEPAAELCDVRRLTEADAGLVSALNVRAWGAWQTPVSLRPWFAATVGRDGFAHYGAFVDDHLVCTGAMCIDGQLAWIGFDATHPRHRSRQLRRSLTCRRLTDAQEAGCTIIHAEGRTDRLSGRSRMLDTLYVRRFFARGDEVVEGPREGS
ncbi:MAG: hypothetical protein ACRDYE_04990, partial [Acidimicrobiales bacterium]